MLGWLKLRFKARKALLVDNVNPHTLPPSPSMRGNKGGGVGVYIRC